MFNVLSPQCVGFATNCKISRVILWRQLQRHIDIDVVHIDWYPDACQLSIIIIFACRLWSVSVAAHSSELPCWPVSSVFSTLPSSMHFSGGIRLWPHTIEYFIQLLWDIFIPRHLRFFNTPLVVGVRSSCPLQCLFTLQFTRAWRWMKTEQHNYCEITVVHVQHRVSTGAWPIPMTSSVLSAHGAAVGLRTIRPMAITNVN